MQLEIQGKKLRIKQYPFRMSSIGNSGTIDLQEIQEIQVDRFPPEIILRSKEVIFIADEYRESLRVFATTEGIPITPRQDIWSLINEPFLDTVHQESYMNNVQKLLTTNQVNFDEVSGIRHKIGETLLIYNAIMWEWKHLGHYDVLLSRKRYALSGLTESFYWWTMKIALRNLHS